MNLLLDTHILLWLLAKPKLLPTAAKAAIEQAGQVFFSPANLWEIGIKSSIWPEYGIQRIEAVHQGALRSNLQELPIRSADTILASQLPSIHRDPFDRLLIAQAHNNGIHLVTVDEKIARYRMPYLLLA